MSISVSNIVFSRIIWLCAVLMLMMAGCGEIYGRDEFAKTVMDKSEQEVTTALGKPTAVDATNPARVKWTYNAVTYDIANGNKRDDKTIVIFAPSPATGQLKVVEVEYS